MKNDNTYESKFNLYDYIPSGICIIDNSLTIIFINYTFSERFNVSKKETVGIKLDEIFPSFNSRYKQRIETVFEYGTPVILSSQLHKNLFKQKNTDKISKFIYNTTITLLPITNESSKEVFAILSLEDVTELTKKINDYRLMKDKTLEEIKNRKIIEEKLIIAKELAEKEKLAAVCANKSKSDFLANMSHEFRTPLNSILGFTSLLSEKNDFDKQSKEFLYSIESSGKMLLSLINDILDLSKVESGILELDIYLVHFDSLLHEIKTTFEDRINKKGLKFITNYNKENLPVFIYTDEIRFKQIIFNLMSNALKFTEKGFIELTITSKEINETMTNLYISVKDTGKGIAEDQTEKIFEEFVQHRGQNYSKYSGTGLGLSITKKLLNKMNGKISLKSKLNYGSTFTVEFNDLKISNKNKDQFSKLSDDNINKKEFNKKREELILSPLSQEESLLFHEIVNRDLLPKWEKIKTTYNIDDIKKFANTIREIANKYKIDTLKNYGDLTYEYADTISLEKLLPHLEQFLTLINKIINK